MSEPWSKWQRWNQVKCPHCGVHHDLSPFDYLLRPMVGTDKSRRDVPVFTCELMKDGKDVGCGQKFEVVKVDNPVLVRVRAADQQAGEFRNIQTDEERKAFEESEVWKEMQKKNPRI